MSGQPLQRILTLQSMLAVILPFGVVVLLGFLWAVPQVRTDAGERQIQLAHAVGVQVESYLEAGAAIVRASASMPFDSRLPQHDYKQHLDGLLGSIESLSSLYTVAPDGTVSHMAIKRGTKHQDDLVNINLSRNPLILKIVKEKKPLWSETFLSVINGGPAVAYGVPGIGATVIGEVDLALLTRFLKQISGEYDITILVIDHNGQVVADNIGRYTAQQLNIGNIPLVRNGLDSDFPIVGRFDFEGNSMTGSIVQISKVDWHVLVARTDASLFHTYRNMTFVVLAGILIAISSGVVASVFQARKLAGHFGELTGHAEEIARGGEPGEWPTSSVLEFNRLSDTLQQMAHRLLDSEILYRTLFEQLPDGIVLWDASNLVPLQFNSAAHQQLGYTREEFSALTVTDFQELQNEESLLEVSRELRTSGRASFESVHRAKGGGTRSVFVSLQIIKLADRQMILALHHDTTEHKRIEEDRHNLEKQLLHSQKLESLGVLAGGIAHDFNNLLMAILGNADLALMRINKESPAVENLQRIEQATARAADLAKQMLAYSGKGKFVVEQLDLNHLLDEMLHMLEVSISKKALLRTNLHNPLPAVEADATQMRQIIMNLVINASEAIGDKSGVITISTGSLECDRSYLKDVWLDENLSDGLYASLEIADTGCGMDKETLAKLFDPFFTTKFTGRGLGMAAVLGIVRGHKGAIKVYSEPGKGTTFKILLPAITGAVELLNHAATAAEWSGSGQVLLVDDEETVLGIGAEMLKELGFSVITAVDGRDALEIFKRTPDVVFVILDMTMPRMDGEQCFRELRKIRSDVRVIMSSGYNEQEVTPKFAGKGLAGFVQKPYRLSTLKDVIRSSMT